MNSQGPDLFAGYIGRFAPSPTGPLHFGSLVTALGSWLDARANKGTWLLRIEDIDPPRERPGAADSIKGTLDALGLHWDGEVIYQGQRLAYFDRALESLIEQQLLYRCVCSRKSMRKTVGEPGHAAGIYPGTCVTRTPGNDQAHSLRIKTSGVHIGYTDRIYGNFMENLATQCGDFIVKRRDGLPAYQLAVVVDDFQQAITHVVRGADLLDNTGRQAYLQSVLGYPRPAYMHLPVVLNNTGQKLSKQTGAHPLTDKTLSDSLLSALAFLHQNPPAELSKALNTEILEWAIANWRPSLIRDAGLVKNAG
ncbi:MAG: tRNA glutamyl-Q(34) synthetase GluQRS [Proteobacteria bacterium]|nr:tRNA glutamyl-Q(34) synthetase GluQRS [Pseudomonadota bacterium]